MKAPPIQYAMTPDGARIGYLVSGSGRPLVFLPSVWSNVNQFWQTPLRGLYESLANRFSLVQYDSRGQGVSSRELDAKLTLADYEADLEAVCERLALRSFVLFGIAAFGHVAIRYAARHPERVEALILWGINDEQGGWHADPFESLAREDWDTFVETAVRIGFPFADAAAIEPVLRGATSQGNWLRMAHAFRNAGTAAYLPGIDVPTLVFSTGAVRPLGSGEAARKIAANIPNALLVELEDGFGGLRLTEQKEPDVVVAIGDFLSNVPTRLVDSTPDIRGRSAQAALSAREIEVLRLIACGKTNKQIAMALSISANTVAKHVANILAKTATANRSDATAYAFRSGIVQPDHPP